MNSIEIDAKGLYESPYNKYKIYDLASGRR